MKIDAIWTAMEAWSSRYDDREVSDEARAWAEMERKKTPRPENDGEWLASMETSFDAGRQFERLTRTPCEAEEGSK